MNVPAKDRPNGPRLVVVDKIEFANPNRRFSADTSYWMTVQSLEFPRILHPVAADEPFNSNIGPLLPIVPCGRISLQSLRQSSIFAGAATIFVQDLK
jgi:hypothetical protein